MSHILEMARRSTSAAAVLIQQDDAVVGSIPDELASHLQSTSQGSGPTQASSNDDTLDDDDFVPPSIGDNGYDQLRKKFFADARKAGAADGKGAVSIANFALDVVKAAGEGLLAVEPPKAPKGEKRAPSDASLAYERYLAGKKAGMEKVNRLAAWAPPTPDSVSKMNSYFKRFIEVGVHVPGAADMLNRATVLIDQINKEHAEAVAEAKENNDPKPVGGVKGGTFNNLYAVAGEQLAKDENGAHKYENDAGTGLRAMTDDEIRGFFTPEGKVEKSELDLLKPVLQRIEDIGSKFQSPEADAAAQAIRSRIMELQAAELAEQGIELVFKPGDKPLTDKQMKVQREAASFRNRA